MPVGVIVLLVVAILVYFGLLHRVLDRMRLDDRTALFILFLMILGSFFNIRIWGRPPFILNVGGAVIPIGVAVYLISTADTRHEKVRGTVAAVISGAAIYLATKILNPEEQTMIIDPTYFFAVIAGVVGYLAGRSRRSAFVGGTMGVVLADIAHFVEISAKGIRSRTWVGGAGVFDAVVIAGVLAVVLAEVVGETREYVARGPLGAGRGKGAGPSGEEDRGAEPGAAGEGGGRETSGGDGGAEGSAKGAGGENFVAAFGVGGGSGRGSRSRASHRAGRGPGDRRARPATTGGAGWEPPIVGDYMGHEAIGSVGAPPAEVLAPGGGATPGGGTAGNATARNAAAGAAGKTGAGRLTEGAAGAGEARGAIVGASDYVTEPENTLAPGTGLDLTAIQSVNGGVTGEGAGGRRGGGRARNGGGPGGRNNPSGRGREGGGRNG